MTAEKFMVEGEYFDEYPQGLRVLAVDDDPICLKLLDTLLKKCQYHVTTTNQARLALKMLREQKDRFDLVISDVHMPDMDGFKLLELVGLEMDLPVIMLSANSDPKLVLKGVTHGACDYLVKPVRIEELSNIWQHVIRRKKPDSKGQKCGSDQDKTTQQNDEGHSSVHENMDVNVTRKRKEDDEDSEDEDPASQKKPRVVWSMVLHRKFVAAVNQLGYDKAVPKRILDLMNVEGLTRENVASHLQKYRLYLKRISSDAKQAAALNSQLIGSYTSLGDMYFPAPGRPGTSVMPPYTTGGTPLRRLDTLSNVGSTIRGVCPSPLIQTNHVRSITGLGKSLSMIQNPSLFSTTLNLDQLQTDNHAMDIPKISSVDDSRTYEASNILTGQRGITGSSNSILNGAGFRNHSSISVANFNSSGLGVSTNLLVHDAVESSKMQPSSLSNIEDSFHSQLPMNIKGDNHFSITPHMQNDLLNTSEPTSLRWDLQGYSNVVGASNSYKIGIVNQNGSIFTNDEPAGGSSNINLAAESMAMTNDTFPLGQTKLLDEFVTRGYDPFDDMEEDETGRSCSFGFDDYSFGL